MKKSFFCSQLLFCIEKCRNKTMHCTVDSTSVPGYRERSRNNVDGFVHENCRPGDVSRGISAEQRLRKIMSANNGRKYAADYKLDYPSLS